MKVHLRRVNEAVHFEATNDRGNTVQIDGAEAIGGQNNGMRPMELMLASVASCSALDLVEILKKQRQPLEDIQIEIEGERPGGKAPTPFTAFRINFTLTGEIDQAKAARAVELSVEKYCSAIESLDPKIDIRYKFTILTPETSD
ncbi:MAG: OsmC family protein [Bacteroidota bacterium]